MENDLNYTGNMDNKHHSIKPIFMVGSGRSGTTLIYDLLANHHDFAWFSNWTNRFPSFPQLALLSRLTTYTISPTLTRQKLWPSPTMEGINIHKKCGLYDLLWQVQRPLDGNDVDPFVAACFKEDIRQHLKFQDKTRFIHKNVNNSMRILYLKEIFPDAKFIHIVRNGMAVALSLNNVAFWKDINLWWTDYSPSRWEEEGKEPLVLCGMHWKKQINAIQLATKQLPTDQYLELRYEDFVENPTQSLKEMVHFCELPWDSRLEKLIVQKNIRNLNNRWQQDIPKETLQLLWTTIQDTAQEFGYSADQAGFGA